jgi:hypothetical protein
MIRVLRPGGLLLLAGSKRSQGGVQDLRTVSGNADQSQFARRDGTR